MASSSRVLRKKSKDRKQNQVNLVSARSRSAAEVNKLSRLNAAEGYSEIRKKRSRNKKIAVALTIVMSSVLVAILAGGIAYAVLNGKLSTDFDGNATNFSSDLWAGTFVEPDKPEDPFWMLLMGTDERPGDDYPRTDTLILARIDPQNKTAALVSIPRDLYVEIPGYGFDKINAAYSLGEQDQKGGGPALTIKTISDFAGVDIAYMARVNFDGIKNIVNDIGGVMVDVPVDIIGDADANDGITAIDIYSGYQELNADQALVFCRSRNFENGDYQRGANQRTFLQALAKQVLAENPATIAKTLGSVVEMTHTNMDLNTIIKVASSMRGMPENAIHTYHVPSAPSSELIDGISYVLSNDDEWEELIEQLDAGSYPAAQDDAYAGVVPEGYVAGSGVATSSVDSDVDTAAYTIDVRNGCGIDGSATAVSDKLVLNGYVKGAIGNTDAYIYPTTLIIYGDENARVAANDIKQRLGYGKVLPSEGRYEFTGNILIVVGNDFAG